MEIERKYLVSSENLPQQLDQFPHRKIVQSYLSANPTVRVRQDDRRFELTYKSRGLMARQEYNMDLPQSSYEILSSLKKGVTIEKTRYRIPLDDTLTVDLDIFHGIHAPLILAEVEFPDLDAAHRFQAPTWFGEEVTNSGKYTNSNLSLSR